MANYIVSDTNLTAVANAIRTKGGTSAPLEFPDDFVSAIGDIQTGGGSSVTVEALSVTQNGTYTAPTGTAYSPVTVNVSGGGTPAVPTGAVRFLDYDGTVVAAYSASEFANLTALPSQPTHSGLTGQGWNWKLADAKTYVQNNGELDIGGYYVTDDGKTRLYIEIPQDTPSNRMTFYVHCRPTVAAGVTIDWGDGTTTTTDSTSSKNYEHTYEATGEYLITLTVSSGTLRLVGSSSQSIFGSTSVTHNLTRIKKVELGSNLHTTNGVGDYAFQNCYSLQSVTIPSGVTSIGTYAFYYCSSLQSVTIPSGVTSIGTSAFQYCYSLQSVTIPSGVTSIGTYAFQYCYSLQSVTVPSGVTSIEKNAFYYCSSLQSVTIPSGVTSIGTSAFQNCYSLQSVTIPSGVTSIGKNAFYYCSSLQSVTIPSGVTSIGTSAFASCTGMGAYILTPETPPTLTNENTFSGIPSDCVIYVPTGKLTDYQTANIWSTWAAKMVEE